MKENMKLDLSLIIPTYNEEKYIGGFLLDIDKQIYKPKEVIIVDGQSCDNTKNIVKKFPFAKFVVSPVKGVGYQRKLGDSLSSGSLLFFLDADVRFSPRFIKNAILEFFSRNLDIACPRYLAYQYLTESDLVPYRSPLLIDKIYTGFNILFKLFENLSPSGAGEGILVKKDVYKKFQFDPSTNYDDIELIRRISRHKYQFGLLNTDLFVSDRRFQQLGIWKSIILYLKLSVFFSRNQFHRANYIKYFD